MSVCPYCQHDAGIDEDLGICKFCGACAHFKGRNICGIDNRPCKPTFDCAIKRRNNNG
jgi:hypothetical protein